MLGTWTSTANAKGEMGGGHGRSAEEETEEGGAGETSLSRVRPWKVVPPSRNACSEVVAKGTETQTDA